MYPPKYMLTELPLSILESSGGLDSILSSHFMAFDELLFLLLYLEHSLIKMKYATFYYYIPLFYSK